MPSPEPARAAPEDRFPTRLARTGELTAITPRAGAVVRGAADELAQATAVTDAAARFEADGFLEMPEFFPEARVAEWRAEACRLEGWCQRGRPPEAFFEAKGGALRSLFDVVRFSRTFASIAHDPRLLAIATALIGDEPYLHQTRLNYKPAYTGSGFFWHSDFETWHAEDGMPDMRAISVSLALCANTEFNGALMLVPGSHLSFVPCVGATPQDHYRQSLVTQEIGTPPLEHLSRLIAPRGIRMPTGRAGSVTVFDCNTMHGSYENLSADPRINLFLVYNAKCNALVEPYAAQRPRPGFIAAR